jgi:rare lipoprotein A
MGSRRKKPGIRPTRIAAGILLLAAPGSAAALAATPSASSAPTAPAASIESVRLGAAHVGYGRHLSVLGTAAPTASGQPVALELDTVATGGWQVVDRGLVGRNGEFRLSAPMHRSGEVRVTGTGGTTPVAGPVKRVSVGSKFSVDSRTHDVLGGQSVTITGRLRPGVHGRRVALQTRQHGRWTTLTSTRTSSRGRFRLRFTPQAVDHANLRVSFAGDKVNTATTATAGALTVFEPTVASWYEDAGNTACGFHAYYGIANKSLPCGTKVTFRSGSRTVVATVDDRGPFVAGRTYDLNQNTAGALGFAGVGTVWASI